MRSNTNEFIEKAIKIHGNKYDYSQVNYITSNKKITILCPYHGNFKQTPNDHLSKKGCRECKKKKLAALRSLNPSAFIEKAKKIHGDRYDYSKSEYTGARNKVTIICLKHGEFHQTATDHLSGKGCRKCGVYQAAKNRSLTTEEFVKRANQVHGNKYHYHKSEYKTMHKKVLIVCEKHGDFLQTPLNHIFDSNGCPQCRDSKGEMRIRRYLESKEIIYHSQHREPECKCKKPLPFDFMIEHDSQKFFIEFQGQQHFYKATGVWKGSKKQLEDIQKRDNIKKEWCKKNKIPLLIITHKEFDLIEEKIYKFLNL